MVRTPHCAPTSVVKYCGVAVHHLGASTCTYMREHTAASRLRTICPRYIAYPSDCGGDYDCVHDCACVLLGVRAIVFVQHGDMKQPRAISVNLRLIYKHNLSGYTGA